MLIASERHTKRDLEFWAELEAADIVHGARTQLADRIERSSRAIRDFARGGNAYVSVSWGKDSVVLADLCRRAAPDLPLVYLKAEPTGNPLCLAVRDAYLGSYPTTQYSERTVDYRAIDPGLGCDETEKAKDRLFYGEFRAVEKRWGTRHISGIRADESSGRKARMKRWGLASLNALAPLGWWSVADVFGYLAVRGLPVHPNYAMLGGGRWPREHLRVDELGGDRGTGFGRADWEREYYGDILRRITS
jgi:phosphoadenosine phosphosulfate reductase